MRQVSFLILFIAFLGVDIPLAQSKSVIVFAVEQRKAVAISIIKKPDYLAIPVKIVSDQKYSSDRFKEISKARELLIQACDNDDTVTLYAGPVYLSPVSKSFMKSMYSSSYQSSQANMHVMLQVSEDNIDVFKGATKITRLVKNIKAPGKASFRLAHMELGVENPDQYRLKLIEMVQADIDNMQTALKKKGIVSLSGLEGPVLVRQVNDNTVELFLDYQVSIKFPAEDL